MAQLSELHSVAVGQLTGNNEVTAISIIISLFAGYSDNIDNYLSFSRTIMFFPIFYLGYLFTSEHTRVLRNKKFIHNHFSPSADLLLVKRRGILMKLIEQVSEPSSKDLQQDWIRETLTRLTEQALGHS